MISKKPSVIAGTNTDNSGIWETTWRFFAIYKSYCKLAFIKKDSENENDAVTPSTTTVESPKVSKTLKAELSLSI